MIGILIATHGGFAEGLLSAVELIAGKQDHVETVGLYHGDGIEVFEKKVNDALDRLDDGDGVIAFVDILGGSPSNVIMRSLGRKKFYAIAGVNMAMTVQACMMRDGSSLDELYETVLQTAKQPPILLHEMYEEMSAGSEATEEDEF
ncbi:MAG: PTS sugar transporter subunit IIA [Anaerostipes sp.]|jgi:PTS system mannose-specific IIA component|nr:PTS sugar transporter subunit IIA [Anaerostipes sp.]MDD3746019.1 PTS sugar transporter subunit IIA [Anaerostipes sp.]